MKTIFTKGMKVYDQVLEPNKKGTIVEIKEGCLIAFPVSVQFENCTDIRSYTLDGRYNRNGEQTLSTKPYKVVYEGFEQKVAQGDKVKAGDVLGTFEAEKIAAAGLDDTTMVIVTNTADYASVTPVAEGALAKGDAVIEVKA